MSRVASAICEASYIDRLDTDGASAEAVQLQTKVKAEVTRLRSESAASIYYRMYSQLCEIAERCHVKNWDGYEAEAVPRDVILQAFRFSRSLPSYLAPPEILPETDGEIEFEWYGGKQRLVSVSVGEAGTLTYVARFGSAGKMYGTESFQTKVPPIILTAIQRVMPAIR